MAGKALTPRRAGSGTLATAVSGSDVPRGLSAQALAATEAGTPDETRRGYSGDWRRFTAWCAATGRQALPCSGETLTEYVTHLKQLGRRPGTLDRAMASIAVAHAAAEKPKPSTTGARLVLRGYEKQLHATKDPRRSPRKAEAATPPVLRQLVAATDTTTLIGLRDVAAMLVGFALAARRGELPLLDWLDLPEVEAGLQADVYRPKVTKQQPIGIPYGSHPATCPVRALRTYRLSLVAAGWEPVGPVFVRIDRHGVINRPMYRRGKRIGDPSGRITGEAIGDLVARAARRAGLADPPEDLLADLPPRWSGHSLRRGFAKAARQSGADMIETARHGGWVDGSKALAGYFDEAGIWDDTNPLYGIGL